MARFSIRGGGGGEGGGGEGSSDHRSLKRLRPIGEEFAENRYVSSSEEEEEEQAEVESPYESRGGSSDGDRDRGEAETESRLGTTTTRPIESQGRPRHGSPLRICSNVRSQRNGSQPVTLDSDILDCNICYEPLTIPIFQCENGHIACFSCCTKLRNKCPTCSLPIGYNRCRAMEKVLESARIPCLNAKYGCPEKFTYASATRSNHENNCRFSPCACPNSGCTLLTSYKGLQVHFWLAHKDSKLGFKWGRPFFITLDRVGMHKIFQEENDHELFVLQCFVNLLGESVSMSCIAPPLPGMGEFSYSLVIKDSENSLSFKSARVRKIQKVIHSPPDSGFFLVPKHLLNADPPLKLEVCILRASQTRV